MLTPRELEVLDVVGEVMKERLQEVRREYEGQLTELRTKVAALEARPEPNLDPIWNTVLGLQERFVSLPPPSEPPDLTPLTEKIAALEARPEPDITPITKRLDDVRDHINEVAQVVAANVAVDALAANVDERFKAFGPLSDRITALETRAPEVTLESVRKMGDDIEEVIERRFAMIPPPVDLAPLTEKVAALEARPEPDVVGVVNALEERVAAPIGALRSQVSKLEQRPEPDLTPLTDQIAEISEKVAGLATETKVDHVNLDNLHERVMAIEALPAPPDLAPLEAKVNGFVESLDQMVDAIDQSAAGVLAQAKSAVAEGQADIIARTEECIATAFAALPPPEKGAKGDPGDPGRSVTVEDFRPTFEAAYARHELETERRIMDLVQRTLDRIPVPKNGKDGVDGLGFDDLDVVQTGDRTIEIRYARGEKQKVFVFKFPWVIDRGVWKEGTIYEKGDVVTWGGSSWIVTCDNPSGKPKDGVSPDWRLMAKSGRDGKPGAPGLKGDPGAPGKNGRDLNTPLGFTP